MEAEGGWEGVEVYIYRDGLQFVEYVDVDVGLLMINHLCNLTVGCMCVCVGEVCICGRRER